MPPPRTIHCTRHPGEPAAWICTRCRYALCSKCAMGTVIQSHSMVRCMVCSGEAKILLVPGRITPYWDKLGSFLRGMIIPPGVAVLGLLALAQALVAMIPAFGRPAAAALLCAYYFMVLRDSARGRVHLPVPRNVVDFGDLLADLFFSTVKLLMATAILWIPPLVIVFTAEQPEAYWNDPALLLREPAVIALLVLAVVYLPGALVVSTIGESLLGPLNPVYTIRRMIPVWRQYLLTVAVWAVLLLTDWCLGQLFGRIVAVDSVVVLTPFLHRLVRMVFTLMSAFVLGRFVIQNGESFNVVPAGEFLVPAMPGAEPKGSMDDG